MNLVRSISAKKKPGHILVGPVHHTAHPLTPYPSMVSQPINQIGNSYLAVPSNLVSPKEALEAWTVVTRQIDWSEVGLALGIKDNSSAWRYRDAIHAILVEKSQASAGTESPRNGRAVDRDESDGNDLTDDSFIEPDTDSCLSADYEDDQWNDEDMDGIDYDVEGDLDVGDEDETSESELFR